MPQRVQSALEPRKSPVQARSAASVDAILEAALQVLVLVGKQRLTTTRVAARAGVSVGTLYQYFPNKTSLLKAALVRHLDEVTEAIDTVCLEQRGASMEQMATALMGAFLDAKMKLPQASRALYAVSSDVDGAAIARERSALMNAAIVAMLKTSVCHTSGRLSTEPWMIASMLQSILHGISRRLLDAPEPEAQLPVLRQQLQQEMVFMACTYLRACATR